MPGHMVIYLLVLQTCSCWNFIFPTDASHLGHLEKVSQALRHTAKSLAELNTLIKNVLSNNTCEKASTTATSLTTVLQSNSSATENTASTTSLTSPFLSTVSDTENLTSVTTASSTTILQSSSSSTGNHTIKWPDISTEQTSTTVTFPSIHIQTSPLSLGSSTFTLPNMTESSESYEQSAVTTKISANLPQTSPSGVEYNTGILQNGSVSFDPQEQTSPAATASSSLLETSQSATEISTFVLTNASVSLDFSAHTSTTQPFSSTLQQINPSVPEDKAFILPNVSVSLESHEETSVSPVRSSTILQTEVHTASPVTQVNTETSTQILTNGSVHSSTHSSLTIVHQSSSITPLSFSTVSHPEYANASSTLSTSDLTTGPIPTYTPSTPVISITGQQTTSFSFSRLSVTDESTVSHTPFHFSSSDLPLQNTLPVSTTNTPFLSSSLLTPPLTTAHESLAPLTTTIPSWSNIHDITTTPTQHESTTVTAPEANTIPILHTNNLTSRHNIITLISSDISTPAATTPTLADLTLSTIPESVTTLESSSTTAPTQEHVASVTSNLPFSSTVQKTITFSTSREDSRTSHDLNITYLATSTNAPPTAAWNTTVSPSAISSNIYETTTGPTSRTTSFIHTNVLSSESGTPLTTVHMPVNYSSSDNFTLTSTHEPATIRTTGTFTYNATDESVSRFTQSTYFGTSYEPETSTTSLSSSITSSPTIENTLATAPHTSSFSLATTQEHTTAPSNSSLFISQESTTSPGSGDPLRYTYEPLTLQTASSHLHDTNEPVISHLLNTSTTSTTPAHTTVPLTSSSLSSTNVLVKTPSLSTSFTTTLVPVTLSVRSNSPLATAAEADTSTITSRATPRNSNEPTTSTITLMNSEKPVSSLNTSHTTPSIPVTRNTLEESFASHISSFYYSTTVQNNATLHALSSNAMNVTNKVVTSSTLDVTSPENVTQSDATSNISTLSTTHDIPIRTFSDTSTVTDVVSSLTLPPSNTTDPTIKLHSTLATAPSASFLSTMPEPVISLSNISFSTDTLDNFQSDVTSNVTVLASTFEETSSLQSSSSVISQIYRDTTSSSSRSPFSTSMYVDTTVPMSASTFLNTSHAADTTLESSKTSTTSALENVISSLSSTSTFMTTQRLVAAVSTASATPEPITSSVLNDSDFTTTADSDTFPTVPMEAVTPVNSDTTSVATVYDSDASSTENILAITTTQNIFVSAGTNAYSLIDTQETTPLLTQSLPLAATSSFPSGTTRMTDTSSQESISTTTQRMTTTNVVDTERTRKQTGDYSRRRSSKGRRSVDFQNKYERHHQQRSQRDTKKKTHMENAILLKTAGFLKSEARTKNIIHRIRPVKRTLQRRKREWDFSTTQRPDLLEHITSVVTASSEHLKTSLGSNATELTWWDRVNITVINIAEVMTEVENGPVNYKQANRLEKAASSLDDLVEEGSNITQLVENVSVEDLQLMIDKLSSVEEAVHNTSLNVFDKIEKKKHLNSIIIVSAAGSTVVLVLLILILVKRRPWRRAIVIYITDTKRTRRCHVEAGHVYLDNDSLGMSTGSFTSYSDAQDFSDNSSVENAYPLAIIKEIRG